MVDLIDIFSNANETFGFLFFAYTLNSVDKNAATDQIMTNNNLLYARLFYTVDVDIYK